MLNRRYILNTWVLVAVCGILLFISGCRASPSPSTAEQTTTAQAPRLEKTAIYTGGTGGIFYPLGKTLADIINSKVPGVEAAAVSSGGSVDNARAIAAREAGLALIQNDIADFAYQGHEMFAGSPVSNIRGIASWYSHAVQFITLKESGIKAISDLKGKRVAVGALGSGTRVEAMAILNAAGINPQNTTILDLDFEQETAALQDKTIDAGCVVAGTPTPAVMDLANSREIYILEIANDAYNAINTQYPFFTRQIIPSGTYKGLDKDIQTLGVLSMLVAGAEISDEISYNITKAMFENLDTLIATHIRAGDIHLSTALEGMTIPLHPGAQKYYKEKGLIQ